MGVYKNQSELQFEREVIDYLTKIGGVKQWEYLPNIKTTEGLWNNFKNILEKNNIGRIPQGLTDIEFNQVKAEINKLRTPYQAGQFLYGTNGVSEVQITLENGKLVHLKLFDQAHVGGGDTVYQIVNQIQRPKVVDGKQDRRFDVTLLINGLPIIQIELKKSYHTTAEAINQFEQYIKERQYGDIYSTLQILVAMTPYDIKYMANTLADIFNRAFIFNWQNESDAKIVRNWKEFCDKVLSIPMAHDLATRFMVLDGTKNKESIKVMRPYQVYATKRVLDKVKSHNFDFEDGKLGYVWHTTGSGKTITSFKTAWLASRLPNVDKVIFLVDRIALTNQTVSAYRAYDPISGFEGKDGVVNDTQSVRDLHQKLISKSDKNIIVTSIQKMSKYVQSEYFKDTNDKILFIVDEAHRSTGDGSENESMLNAIRTKIRKSAWVGYTGTPIFENNTTQKIFGDILHAYTIKEAIADKNVLGFHVEFKDTEVNPEDITDEELINNIKETVYDTDERHLNFVVNEIFTNWKKRSNNRKYNALLTVRVGGNKASTPRAFEYYEKFLEENAKRPENERLKVAISFSQDTSNKDSANNTNDNLHKAIMDYNQMFGTNFDMSNVKGYAEDFASRLNRTVDDKNYLDLGIVVDQLLTGFDAPKLNTLYVDRVLKEQSLIQAYSRTNRMENIVDKPWGIVVNYRWPQRNEALMNEAFAKYSNRDSAAVQEDMDIDVDKPAPGVIAEKFSTTLEKLNNVIDELRPLTHDFNRVPESENKREDLYQKLKEYNKLMSMIKQYSVDENENPIDVYENPELIYEKLNINPAEEEILTTVIAYELKVIRSKRDNIDISQIDLEMIHINDVTINYDYLTELIAKFANEIHDKDFESADKTYNEIKVELAKSESDKEIDKYTDFVDRVKTGEYVFKSYPAPTNPLEMDQAIEESFKSNSVKLITEFIRYWGIDNAVNSHELKQILSNHKKGQRDLDKKNELANIIKKADMDYQEIAHEDIKQLKKIQYRNNLREDFYRLAEELVKYE